MSCFSRPPLELPAAHPRLLRQSYSVTLYSRMNIAIAHPKNTCRLAVASQASTRCCSCPSLCSRGSHGQKVMITPSTRLHYVTLALFEPVFSHCSHSLYRAYVCRLQQHITPLSPRHLHRVLPRRQPLFHHNIRPRVCCSENFNAYEPAFRDKALQVGNACTVHLRVPPNRACIRFIRCIIH
jgi:hypothetical protein